MTYQEDAFLILNDAGPATDRALLASATGAALHPHAQQVWCLIHSLWQQDTCWTNVGGRNRGGTDKGPDGVRIHRLPGAPLQLTWPEVAAPLGALDNQTRSELEAALRERADAAGRDWPPTVNDWYSAAERQLHRIARWEVEGPYYQLGDRLWGLCHPDVAGPTAVVHSPAASAAPVDDEPTDLLELLAAGGGA